MPRHRFTCRRAFTLLFYLLPPLPHTRAHTLPFTTTFAFTLRTAAAHAAHERRHHTAHTLHHHHRMRDTLQKREEGCRRACLRGVATLALRALFMHCARCARLIYFAGKGLRAGISSRRARARAARARTLAQHMPVPSFCPCLSFLPSPTFFSFYVW